MRSDTLGRLLLWGVREVRSAVFGLATRLRLDGCIRHRLGAGDFWRGGSATSVADVLLCLGGVISCVGLDGLVSTSGVVACEVPDLPGLLVDEVGGIAEMLIDKVLIGHVDQGAKVNA